MSGIQKYSSIEQAIGLYQSGNNKKTNKDQTGKSFQSVLDQVSSLTFSKHASERLEQRDISLSDEQSKRLEDGVDKAEKKGIKDSLVLMDSLAFIVNVPSHTVITALDSDESKDKAFTNIDGAVIV
ncbi:MAG: TIGR02530 family flagellar biosynthesis protein [Lachnospiraceae bacterium]|nr:TIGR02530 family flagellar biosynthesis protein [Lachnospiraceae bacterium]